jgi:predicted metal-dependent phosphoesterase TrpH
VSISSETISASAARFKVDFHLHSAEDPMDAIDHSASELVVRAAQLGFDAIAITLHGHVLHRPELCALAQRLGILLVPAAEMRLEGADVVVLNLSEAEAASLHTLSDLRRLREQRGPSVLIFAPHPFFILGGSIGKRIEHYIDCFDAIEYCHFHTRWLNLNHFAVCLAEKFRKPLVATSDAHRLDFFGDHYSLVTTTPKPAIEDLFNAIRDGKVERISPAWPTPKFLHYLWYLFATHPLRVRMSRLQH